MSTELSAIWPRPSQTCEASIHERGITTAMTATIWSNPMRRSSQVSKFFHPLGPYGAKLEARQAVPFFVDKPVLEQMLRSAKQALLYLAPSEESSDSL